MYWELITLGSRPPLVPVVAPGLGGSSRLGISCHSMASIILTDHAVGQDHDGVTVVVGHVKGNLDIVRSLLNGGGGEDQVAVVAVAAAPGGFQ